MHADCRQRVERPGSWSRRVRTFDLSRDELSEPNARRSRPAQLPKCPPGRVVDRNTRNTSTDRASPASRRSASPAKVLTSVEERARDRLRGGGGGGLGDRQLCQLRLGLPLDCRFGGSLGLQAALASHEFNCRATVYSSSVQLRARSCSFGKWLCALSPETSSG